MTVVPATVHRAAQLLTQLGNQAEDIAVALQSRRIKGDRERGEKCPIAVYLLQSDLGLADVAVGEEEIQLDFDGHAERVDTTPAVRRFIIGFDRGRYPALDAAAVS